ncbi:MAG: ATP-binding cassette domain-containing protein [Rhizobiaceae bacterium]
MVNSVLPVNLSNAVVKKRGKTIIGPVDLEIGPSGFSVIMGPNGSGKTTLLRLLHGLERPRQGTVSWNCTTSAARKKQAFVFQTPIMLRRTAAENIAYPLKLHKIPRSEITTIVRDWLNRIGLSKVADLNASFLSGGEKQKLAIARALVVNPEVLFLDEPTTNLDGKSIREIETILNNAIEQNIRIIMTTHDIGQANRLADDILFLYRGRVHEHGPAGSFLSNPKTPEAKAFLKGDIVE